MSIVKKLIKKIKRKKGLTNDEILIITDMEEKRQEEEEAEAEEAEKEKE